MRNDPQPTIATDEHLIFGRIKKVEVAVARVVKCDVWKQPSRQLAGRTTIKFWAVGQHQLWIVIVICDEPRLSTHVQYPIIFVMRSQRWPQVKLCGTPSSSSSLSAPADCPQPIAIVRLAKSRWPTACIPDFCRGSQICPAPRAHSPHSDRSSARWPPDRQFLSYCDVAVDVAALSVRRLPITSLSPQTSVASARP